MVDSLLKQFAQSSQLGANGAYVEDLYERVKPGTRVVVLPGAEGPATASVGPSTPRSGGGGAIAAEPLQPPRQLTR